MKKKIIFIILIVLIIAICVSCGIVVYLKQRDDKIALIENNIVIEYGENYTPSINELIDLNEFDFIDTTKVVIESNIVNEENKEYPAVGNYEINVYYNEKSLAQNVEVKDTTKPELSIQEKIDVENGIDINTVDIKQYAKVSDLSKLKDYNIDLSNVDTSKAGEYVAKISIEDIYGNKSEKEFKIVVAKKIEPVVEVKEENVVDNNTTQSKTQTKTTNETTTTNNSSNNSSNKATGTTSSTTSNKTKSEAKSSNKEQQNNASTTAISKPVWCDEGGTKHWQGNGPNEHRLL